MSPKKTKAQTERPRARRQAQAAAAAQADAPVPTGAPAQAGEPAQADTPVHADTPAQRAAPAREVKGARTLTGRVVSNRTQKTIAVEIERLIKHPQYGKFIRRTTRLLAHDETGASQEGDLVTITPCRPMSRHKSWRLLAVVSKAAGR
jgi:small subunit ribosomal protein S17